jgi:hypothetical protein
MKPADGGLQKQLLFLTSRTFAEVRQILPTSFGLHV